MKKITTFWLLCFLVSSFSFSFGGNLTADKAVSSFETAGDSIPFLSGWSSAKVLALPKGKRPAVKEYLPASYIQTHHAIFESGASYLVPKAVLDKYGRKLLGRTDGQFVMSNTDMNLLMRNCEGKLSYVEKELGIPAGAWAGKELVRIDVFDPYALNLRMPTGNESGANDLWLPGGKLPTGFWEAVVDAIPEGKYYETAINLQ